MIPSPGAPAHTRHTLCVSWKGFELCGKTGSPWSVIMLLLTRLGQWSGGGPLSTTAVWSQGSGGNRPSVTSLLPSVQEALAFCVAGNHSRLKVGDCLQGNHTGKFIPPTSPAPTFSVM